MKIIEINCTDIIGHIFNGFDLMKTLNDKGFDVKQVVFDKKSNDTNVVEVRKDLIVHNQIMRLEKKYSVSNVLFPYGQYIYSLKEYKEADIVHFHILHNSFISIYDYPLLMNSKKSIWTIHDPWILTGNCIYPLECNDWKNGCTKCDGRGDHRYKMVQNNMDFMWNQKKEVLSKINPDIIVSCNYMKRYLEESPLTRHFNKIHVIPFGLQCPLYAKYRKDKKIYGLNESKITIGFRVENSAIKGCEYIYEALRKYNFSNDIEIFTVGSGTIPKDIALKYNVINLGWVYDEKEMVEYLNACDIFLMPSLAETFGMMAIESMAAGNTVICFQNTVLEQIVDAPDCGIAVEYKSSESLAEEIKRLLNNRQEIFERGEKGKKLVEKKFKYEEYIRNHEQLYMNIGKRK